MTSTRKNIVCQCGKGYASQQDEMCRFCREKLYRRAQCKSVGVRHRGDGLTLDQQRKIKR